MAWAMISGLVGSTFLTVLVVPALYRLLFARDEPASAEGEGEDEEGEEDSRAGSRPAAAAAALSLLLAVGLAVPAVPAVAQGPTEGAAALETITLEEALDLGAGRPQAQAADLRAEAAGQAAVAQRRAALWPVVTAGASVVDRTEDFELVTPIGSFDFGDSRSEDVEVAVVQPLLDLASWSYGTPAAEADAAAARASAGRTGQVASARAGEAYLDVLALDARRSATEAFISSLGGRLEETEARVEAGRSLEADALKVRLALDGARQDLLALEEARQVALANLGRSIGRGRPVEVKPPADLSVSEPPALAAALEQAYENREDLEALEQSAAATELRGKEVKAELLPRLQASARWISSTGSPYRQESWVEGTIGLRWNPFAAGTRAPRRRALEGQLEAQRSELLEVRRGIEIEVRSAYAGLATARGALAVGESGVRQATETLRVERERYDAGRSTTNDLLDAEAALRDQRTRREVARIDLLRAWLRLQLALGEAEGRALLAES